MRWNAVFLVMILGTTVGALSACTVYDYDGGCRDDDLDGRFDEHAPSDTLGEACRSAAECSEGERCFARVCVPGDLTLPCATDAECAEGEVCGEDGACAAAPSGCRDASECADAEVCVDARCVPAEDTCQFDHECGPGRGCVDSACRDACADDGDCADGHACDAARCLPIDDVCADDGECAEGERCLGGRCFAECADDADCAEGSRCGDDGACRADTGPRAFCETDEDCAEGHLCIDGSCRTPCPSGEDDECRRSDHQLIRCGESMAGPLLCYTFSEWNPQCSAAGECEDGERCSDGLCVR